jgi:ADP-ribose pyrophosphatase YjhB (NUDIX family)
LHGIRVATDAAPHDAVRLRERPRVLERAARRRLRRRTARRSGLLARRGIEPRQGKYVLPGGFVEFDETPYEAARREMREETSLDCPELDLLEVHTVRYRENEASLSIVFHARPWLGDPKAGDDAAALVWRPVDAVESDEFAWHIPGLADKLRRLRTDGAPQ